MEPATVLHNGEMTKLEPLADLVSTNMMRMEPETALRDGEKVLLELYGARVLQAKQVLLDAQREAQLAHALLLETERARVDAQTALDTMSEVVSNARATASRMAYQYLPANLLTDVFLAVISTDTHTASAPFRFAAVCAHWRRVALDCSALWARLKVDVSVALQANAYLELMLARSREVALEVDLRGVLLWHPQQPPITTKVLLQLFRRSRSMHLGPGDRHILIPEGTVAQTILPFLQTPMPSMEEFSIIPSNNPQFDYDDSIEYFTLAPNLKILNLGFYRPSMFVAGYLPNLVDLQIRGTVPSDDLLAISRGWPRLKRLALATINDGTPSIAEFLHLEELDCVVTAYEATEIFSQLSAAANVPKLRTLSIFAEELPVVHSFLSQGPSTSITTLTITDMPGDYLGAVLRDLPQLSHLRLDGITHHGMTRMLEMWCFLAPAWFAFFPALGTLSLIRCDFDLQAAHLLLEFLAARAQWVGKQLGQVIPLRRLEFSQGTDTSHPFPRWLAPRLEQIVNEVIFETQIPYTP